jgi:hypothetical protein
VSIDWTTAASLGTAAGTLVLAIATFASVRSANRATRIAQRQFEIGLRPILAPSRLEDLPQKVMFRDRHWVKLEGGRAVVEEVDGVVYLAMLVRNVGNGMAIIESWEPSAGLKLSDDPWGSPDEFRSQTRTLWISPNDVAFWQGALRDQSDAQWRDVSAGVAKGELTVDLFYRDHDGGQRTISRFSLIRREVHSPGEEGGDADGAVDQEPGIGDGSSDSGMNETRDVWWVSLSFHRSLDDE